MPEILAPVGGPEQLLAAVRCGANAVYLGAGDFNARRNAENFSLSSLQDTVRYCHSHGVAVHVTLNTLVRDAEQDGWIRTLDSAAEAGVDAVIVQDLGMMQLALARYPQLAVHASTQCVVHNSEGARFFQQLGVRRVVLARELSLAEIRRIRENTTVELEVFVHGALCMSMSGGCYLSSMIGGRSGNRGLCAQPCRLDFRCGSRSHALSLKDLSNLDHLRKLAEAGVCSFKIEGRMKRPEYVAAAVTACRQALAGEPYDAQTLRAVFSRSGFTDGYLLGKRDATLFGSRSKEDVTAAQPVFGALQQLYHKETPLLGVDATLQIDENRALLSACSGSVSASVSADGGDAAKTRPTDKEQAEKFLGKTGGTQFYLRTLDLQNPQGLVLPPSRLNALRRDLLQQLDSGLGKVEPLQKAADSIAELPPRRFPADRALWARFSGAQQLFETLPFDRLILPAEELLAHPELILKHTGKLAAELPALLFPQQEAELPVLLENLRRLGVDTVFAENVYAVQAARSAGFAVLGGAYLNIMNSRSLEMLRQQGLSAAVLSFELTMRDMEQIGGSLPFGYLLYGRLPLMRMRSCPVRAAQGCAACGGAGSLTDRTGAVFPVRCEKQRFSVLYNSVPLHLGGKPQAKADFGLLYFTDESADACRAVTQEILENRAPKSPRTTGLYFRGVQ